MRLKEAAWVTEEPKGREVGVLKRESSGPQTGYLWMGRASNPQGMAATGKRNCMGHFLSESLGHLIRRLLCAP